MGKDKEIKINADRIRNMTNDELAEFLFNVNCAYPVTCMIIDEDCKYFPNKPKSDEMCKGCFKQWLENENGIK